MLVLYKFITALSAPVLGGLLSSRVKKAKEDPKRINERRGITNITRPSGTLIWLHAASVGEAQSALILIKKLSEIKTGLNFLVTSGTLTSATLMANRLPANAIHQFYPLDHPKWVEQFLTHWKPDLALWMESELWPNMLGAVKAHNIPAILINARLSEKSFSRWKILKSIASKILSTFTLILTQTTEDEMRYKELGAREVITTDNLKHSATPLPYNKDDLVNLKNALQERPLWLYASSHSGEEEMSCRLHAELKEKYPSLLTILVPRHPERREEIKNKCALMGLNVLLRGDHKNLPTAQTDIYIADTLGELGLFYTLVDIAMIGRSFSHDGGGGHNPIEAAQLDCAVITGVNVQYQKQLFNEMFAANAAQQAHDETELYTILNTLLSNEFEKQKWISAAKNYAASKENIADKVITHIMPYLKKGSS